MRCAQMSMPVTAHWGCTDTVRECTGLKFTLEEKSLAAPASVLRLVFSQALWPLSSPCPIALYDSALAMEIVKTIM